jgi:DNA-binding XRE family transcriptional regulator
MLTEKLLEGIRGMLVDGNLSQRAIAERLGVTRAAVQAVARGRYRLYVPLKRSSSGDFQPPRGSPVRCPNCGVKVKMPCLACYLRGKREEKKGDREQC